MNRNKLGLKNGEVQLVPHNLIWSEVYRLEEIVIKSVLQEMVVNIEHVGSTSIPVIEAKPILDILVIVKPGVDEAKVLLALGKAGYEKGLFQRRGEIFFLKSINDIHTHYIHLVSEEDDWKRYTLFRDHLNSNTQIAKSYEQMKKDLAAKHRNNRKEYTAAKELFVESILSNLR